MWGLRNKGSIVDFTGSANISRQYVVGLPLDGQKAKNKKNLWKVINSWSYAEWTTHAWSLTDWLNNVNNCRMKLTKDNANLYLVNVKKDKWNEGIPSEAKFNEFKGKGSGVI